MKAMIARVLILILSFRIFNKQIIVRTDNLQNLSYTNVSKISEPYLEPVQVFKMAFYVDNVNSIKLLAAFWQKAPS